MSARLELRTGVPRLTLFQQAEGPILALPAIGPRGIPGPIGPIGIGLQGDKGDRGERGPPGDTTIKVIAASGLASSHSGDTTETALATISIPARAMGNNGRLRVRALFSMTNNANNKVFRVRFGGIAGTIYHEESTPSKRVLKIIADIDNRNAPNTQVGPPLDLPSYGSSTGTLITSAVDTDAAPVDLALTATLANPADTATLEAYVVELLQPPLEAQIGLYFAGDGIIITDEFEVMVDRDTVAPVISPSFGGAPAAPTPADAINNTQIATTAFVHSLINALSGVYLTSSPSAARTALGLGDLALLDLISFADLAANAVATISEYRSAAASKLLTAKTVFDAHAYVTLTDAASIVWDQNAGFNFTVSITANRSLAFPTNPKVGQSGVIEVIQPNPGGKLLAYDGGFQFDGASPPVIASGNSAKTALYYHQRSLTVCWIGVLFSGIG